MYTVARPSVPAWPLRISSQARIALRCELRHYTCSGHYGSLSRVLSRAPATPVSGAKRISSSCISPYARTQPACSCSKHQARMPASAVYIPRPCILRAGIRSDLQLMPCRLRVLHGRGSALPRRLFLPRGAPLFLLPLFSRCR